MLYQESSLSQEKRRRQKKAYKLGLLCLSGVAIAVALGIRLWSDRHAPPVHSMRVSLTEDKSGDTKSGDLFGISLKAGAAPHVSGDHSLEGPKCLWSVDPIMYRSSPNETWQEEKGILDSFPNGQPTNSTQIWLPPLDAKAGEWKSTVHVTVEYWDGNTKEVWRGAATHEINEHYSQAEFQQRTAQRAKLQREDRIAQQKALHEPSPGETALIPGKKYIAKLQYAEDSGHTWHDVPLPGSPDYPLVVQQYWVTGFRAVKTDPKLKWPDWPEVFPQWSDGKTDGYMGNTLYFQFDPSLTPEDLRTVTARCGNQVSAKIRVLPDGELVVYSNRENLVTGAQQSLSQSKLSALCNLDRTERTGAKVHFAARYADGTNADLINGPGVSDDIVPLDNGGSAHAVLRAGSKTGQVRISAFLYSPQGRQLANTDHDENVNLRARWWLEEHTTQP